MEEVVEQLDRATMDEAPSKDASVAYLKSLINKRLRIHGTDGRIFVGNFKCTDTDSNVVLSATYEYRQPSQPQPLGSPIVAAVVNPGNPQETLTRHLGLVVVPGEHIVKIEIEEFTSQVRVRYPWGSREIYGSAR